MARLARCVEAHSWCVVQVKRAVMNEAAAPKVPRFNRMSGIQEWVNAIFLFVNVEGDSYANLFLKAGEHMTWFAQPLQVSSSASTTRTMYWASARLTRHFCD